MSGSTEEPDIRATKTLRMPGGVAQKGGMVRDHSLQKIFGW